jgi:hypothetical protein
MSYLKIRTIRIQGKKLNLAGMMNALGTLVVYNNHQECWSGVFLFCFCSVLVWFWYQGTYVIEYV